ncbi:leucine-rich repeat domain-containing protein [Ruminococcus sp. NK3A76]|uniref:leucine-rich repeat domain-containing protein n=1 Tax=Ruminococcus sp. NK3A76 TaxID=877411 RepID=UPI00068F5143|nr:leucine-rich repeat domain-containing protein [Ruminococcus sp. NK3A76]
MLKKILSSVLALCMVFGTAAVLPEGAVSLGSDILASAVTYGDYEYTVLDDGTVEISEYKGSDAEVTIPSTIDGKKVTSIGDFAFYVCESLKSITIPNSVTNIGEDAFYLCESLTSITIPNSVTSIGDYAFCGCKSLTSITIPNSVTSIGKGAFSYCESLTSITIPNSVISIGNLAFYGCDSLTSITIPNSVTSIGVCAFICQNLRSITVDENNKAFSSYDGVLFNKNKTELITCPGAKQRLNIPNGVTSIGDNAFYYCKKMTSVTLPDSITSIGELAFHACTSLKAIALPDSVKSIGCGAFHSCDNIMEISIPKSLTSIGEDAFSNCKNLKRISVDADNTAYSSVDDVLYNKNKTVLIFCPIGKSSITIPSGVTSIWHHAFMCGSITSVVLPDGVKSIGGSAFLGCPGLKSVTIPNSVTSIGDDAFNGCDVVTIKCNSGTAAEKYAKEKNIKYELLVKPAHTHSYTKKVIKPTYDAQGYTLHTCSCGDSYKDTYTAKLTRTSIAKATVSGLSNKTYTGKAITQKPVVKAGGKTLKAGTDYTVTYKNNKAVGTATVSITGKGAYKGTVSKTFKILPKKTTLKTAKSPKTKQLKVTYSKVAGVTGYQVTYSTSAKFTKAATKSVNVKGTSKTISKLTKGKTYYVKVRSYKTVGKTKFYSGYSAVKKVKVK